MALVKCPECGRERVSDTAEACPDCGYNVRAHYERVKRRKRKEAGRRGKCSKCRKRIRGRKNIRGGNSFKRRKNIRETK